MGKLVKAPQFENTVGFDMQKNGLYEILLHVDMGGFIFVNFATGGAGQPVWTSLPKNYEGLFHWESFEIQLGMNWRFAGMGPVISCMAVTDILQRSTLQKGMRKSRRRVREPHGDFRCSQATGATNPWALWRGFIT